MPSLKECAAQLGKALDAEIISQVESYMRDNSTDEVTAVEAILSEMQGERSKFTTGDTLLDPISNEPLLFNDESEARDFISKRGMTTKTLNQEGVDHTYGGRVEYTTIKNGMGAVDVKVDGEFFGRWPNWSDAVEDVRDHPSIRKLISGKSDEFNKWFGTSKVVDEQGLPLVVYHGSPENFEAFDPEKTGDGHDVEGAGFYFTNDKKEATGYAHNDGPVYEVYLRIENPVPLTGKIKVGDVNKMIAKANGHKTISKMLDAFESDMDLFWESGLSNWSENPYDAVDQQRNAILEGTLNPHDAFQQIWYDVFGADNAAFMSAMVELGYDGVIIEAEDKHQGNDHYVVFNPTSIKSVDNTGTFDPNDPRILYQGQTIEQLQKSLVDEFDLKTLLLHRKDDVIKLDSIIVDGDSRKSGVGTQVMEKLSNYADANNLRIALTPAQKDDYQGTTSRSRLVKFYKRFGFVENKGRNKDFTLSEGMYRDPVSDSLTQENRGEIQLIGDQRIIKLGQLSDPSTFIHEMGHLFLETERQFSKEFGETTNQRALLDWLEVESFDDIDLDTPEGVSKHEKFARAFEAYMYEGNAPSLSLRDAFAAIKSWMLRVYESIKQLNVEMNDEIRNVFDRMLATETELEAAKGDPIYSQYFTSPEAAGMTPAEFAEYEKRLKQRDNRATETVDKKLLREYRKRREAEWREERAPLVDDEYERLSKEPVYQLMGDLAIAPMDYDQVIAATDDGKLPGKLIGKARKEDGVDPQEYAEVYGYDSVGSMLADINQAPPLKKAAEDAAQARMIEKYGDIMNDGSLEIEIQDALHNDAQAQVLLMELKALKPESANKINREFLKAEAKRVIAEMTYKEIQPNKYYRNELRAAKRAGEARPDMKAEIYDAKVSQLANHYLYREAVEMRNKMQRNRRYVKSAQKRKYDPKAVDGDYIANIKALATVYDMGDNPARQKQQLSGLLTWFNAAVKREDVELQMMDPNLVLAMAAKENTSEPQDWVNFTLPKFDDLTANDLQGLTDMLKHMRHVGGQMSALQNDEITRERVELTESIVSNGGGDVRDPATRGRKMPPMDHVRHMFNKLPSLRNMMRKLDGVWDNNGAEGIADRLIHRRLEDANNEFLKLKEEIYDRFNEEMEGIHYIGLSGAGFTTEFRRKHGIPDANEFEIIAEGGNKVVMNPEELFMMALYWGTESSRDAIKEGHGLSDADVMRLLSNLTEDQLNFVNKVWKVNESIWPDLSSASIKRYGVSPEKLDAAPFVVNGVEMTGGHMRLFYNSLEIDIKNEQESGQEYASIVPSKAGSLHERVGSGGRPVQLDRNNIVRAIDENIHFIAYAEAGNHIRRLVNARDVQDSIQRKHGEPFHRAMVEQLDMIIRNKPAQEQIKGLAAAFRLLRKAATYRHLVLSVRNIVQQGTALPIIMNEVGTANWISAAQRVYFEKGNREFIMDKSTFMRNRTSFVNREAAEYLNKLSVDGPVKATWERFAAIGFTPQTAVDSVLAFPTWLAKYEDAINKHGDERRAISEADIAVSESVGSGNDLHLGGAFNSNTSELTRTMTLFGSWFNAYYQRMYRDTRGFTTMTPASAHTIFTLPLIVGTMSAVLVADIPDDDSDETIEGWLARNYFMFVAGTVPIVRDMVTFHHSGFSPKTVLSGLQEGPGRVINEVDAMIEGRQSALKTANDLAKIATTIVPVPGSGQVTRTVDFVDAYNQGEEGEMTTFKAYQALVEGPDRNE